MSVRNCHQFIDLSGYRIEWIVANDAGRHLSGGIRDLSSMNTVRPGAAILYMLFNGSGCRSVVSDMQGVSSTCALGIRLPWFLLAESCFHRVEKRG